MKFIWYVPVIKTVSLATKTVDSGMNLDGVFLAVAVQAVVEDAEPADLVHSGARSPGGSLAPLNQP